MCETLENKVQGLKINVFAIRNDFFGENITVSGLLTGQDIIAQLKGKELGERLLLPQNILRSGEDVFLDDIRLPELEKSLQVVADIVKSSGYDFIYAILKGWK
jgi:NifB/MoaA-like Fe-S oxidoreductase